MSTQVAHRVPATARTWFLIAGVATTVSLGMPWKESMLWPIYNIYNPWNCGVDWGGEDWVSQWCFQTLPMYSWHESAAAPGYQTPVRLFVPLALIAVFLGVRLGRRQLVVLGAGIATAGGVLATTSFGPGQTLYVVGVIAWWIGLRRAGMIGQWRTPRTTAPAAAGSGG